MSTPTPTPKTFNGGTQPYASPADFLAIADARLLGDLVRDDGNESTPTDLLSDPNLALALSRASGLVEAYVLKADFYTVADLQALQGNALALLKGIVCGLAIQFLRSRRVYEEPDHPLYKEAKAMLEALAEGVRIFPFQEVEDSGVPETDSMHASDVFQNLPTLITNNKRYWSTRAGLGGYPGGSCGYGGFF